MKTGIVGRNKLTTLITCLSALVSANVYAQKVTIDELVYYLDTNSHEATVYSGNNCSGELDIPSEVSHNGDNYTVKSIFWAAFYDCNELTKVRIPKTVEGVNHIGFSTRAVSPDYMNPFKGCTSLESIEVDENNPNLCSIEGVLYSKDRSELYCYPSGKKGETFVVPNSVKWIGGLAFSSSVNLVSVRIPATVTKICGQAFEECTRLETVNIPETLAFLTSRLFANCSSLKSIDIPASVTRLAGQVFIGCSSLKRLDLPESVRTIGALPFSGCKLESLVIRGLLEEQSVGSTLFYGLGNSTTVYTLPSQINLFSQYFSGKICSLAEYEMAGIHSSTITPVRYASTIHDLQGRRLQTPPHKGVYISGGKKLVR